MGLLAFTPSFDAIMLICRACLRPIHYLLEMRDCFLYITVRVFMHAVIQQGAVRWVIGCTVYSPLKKINKRKIYFLSTTLKKI